MTAHVVGTRCCWRWARARPSASGDTSGYGLGLATEVYRGARLDRPQRRRRRVSHVSGRLPEHGLSWSCCAMASTANPVALARSVADVYVGGKLAVVEPPLKAAAVRLASRWTKLAGVYVNPTTGSPTIRGRPTGHA